jgi:hypothetical protein
MAAAGRKVIANTNATRRAQAPGQNNGLTRPAPFSPGTCAGRLDSMIKRRIATRNHNSGLASFARLTLSRPPSVQVGQSASAARRDWAM